MTPVSTPPQYPFSSGTGLADAQQNQLVSSGLMVDNLNASLKSIYLTAFSNWVGNVNTGRIPNTNPPLPPTAYVVAPPDQNGFQWPDVGTAPVCDMPPIPEDHFTPQPKLPSTTPGIGHWMTGRWYSCLHNNAWTAQSGDNGSTPPTVINSSLGGPAADGNAHIFQFYPAPVGEGWWLMTS